VAEKLFNIFSKLLLYMRNTFTLSWCTERSIGKIPKPQS